MISLIPDNPTDEHISRDPLTDLLSKGSVRGPPDWVSAPSSRPLRERRVQSHGGSAAHKRAGVTRVRAQRTRGWKRCWPQRAACTQRARPGKLPRRLAGVCCCLRAAGRFRLVQVSHPTGRKSSQLSPPPGPSPPAGDLNSDFLSSPARSAFSRFGAFMFHKLIRSNYGGLIPQLSR